MVNLYLTGKANSNVFNDKIELDSGTGSDVTILKGVTGRSNIGLLSLFEHYKSCQVRTFGFFFYFIRLFMKSYLYSNKL